MKEKISVVINTFNAEKHLQEVLEAVKDFDEIVICDMHSSDRTVEIAQTFSAKIIFHEPCHICEPARNSAIQAASHPWVLIVDADEIVTKELREYLYSRIQKPNPPTAIQIPRKNFFMKRFMQCLYPDYIIRFAKKDKIDWPSFIHAKPVINGCIETINKRKKELAFIHLAENSVSDRLQKMDTYTNQETLRRGAKNYNYIALLSKPVIRFFHTYIQKGGFRDGKEGFMYASLNAMYKLSTLMKQIEKNRKEYL